MIKIEVNNKVIHARRGETILSALKSCGVLVPTLCSLGELSPTGACRMCVVEVEGKENLVPACSYPVQEWMKIKTHSPRVLQARKMNVELLLSNHPDDCLYCERNGNCELQKLAENLNVRKRKIEGQRSKYKIDSSSHSIIRDQAKCILCGRCVRICEEVVGVSTIDFVHRGDDLLIAATLKEPLQFSSCIDCGMCVVKCPTGALIDKPQFQELDVSFDDPDKVVVAQFTQATAVSLAEEFGFKPGTDMRGLINNALRKIGFDYIFETAFGADVLIQESVAELKKRFSEKDRLPLLTSSCPAWVNYIEEFRPEWLSNLMPIRSPHQILGKLVKTQFCEANKLSVARMVSVLISNCTAAKHEANRPEYSTHNTQDIDYVLTTRELARLIRLHGIDMHRLDVEPADGPYYAVSSAGKLLANAGGEAEAILRSLYRELSRKEMSDMRISKLRGNKHVRELSFKIGEREVRVAAVNGLNNAIRFLDEMCEGKCNYDLIEVMVCPDGCVNGGGQPIGEGDAVKLRTKTVYDMDKNEAIKVAHKNNAVNKLYEDFARGAGTDESRELFLTKFVARKVIK